MVIFPNYVPILISSEQIDRSVSIADNMASLLVLGLVISGVFSTMVVIFPNLPSASILCIFLLMLGFTTTLTIVS